MLFPLTRNKFNFHKEFEDAVGNCNRSIVALASAAGFGGVVALVPGFSYVLASLDHIPGPDFVQVVVAINLTAGFCGSSSSGLTMALDMLGERFMSFGIPNAALHRLCSISAAGLDSLPHSSAVVNNYYVAKNSFKESYINNFMFSVVFNVLTALFCGFLISLGLTF